jgi:hypothetical protein
MRVLDAFRKVYDLSVSRSGMRVPVIERYLGILNPSDVTTDDQRNEPAFYLELAQDDGQILEDCLSVLLGSLRERPYEETTDTMGGIIFLQAVVSDVLWRYGMRVAARLESFAREYDRLDVPDVRLNLYKLARGDESIT